MARMVHSKMGFSLVELLIATTASLLLIGSLYTFFIVPQRKYYVDESLGDMQQNVRSAMEWMAREFRNIQTIDDLDVTPGSITFTTAYAYQATGNAEAACSSVATLCNSGEAWEADEWAGDRVLILDDDYSDVTLSVRGFWRTIQGNTGNTLTVTPDWPAAPQDHWSYAILPQDASQDAGRSTGGNTATTLVDTTKSWASSAWQNYSVVVKDRVGEMQGRVITSNNSQQVVVGEPWTRDPTDTFTYQIRPNKGFRWDSVAGNLLYVQNGEQSVFAPDITAFTLTGYDAGENPTEVLEDIVSLGIEMTARTDVSEQNTDEEGGYREYSLRTLVHLRNM